MAQHVLHRPNVTALSALALEQGGYVHCNDARDRGVDKRLMYWHAREGLYERVLPCVYRLTIAPYSEHDDLWRALVWSSLRGAISHQSALQVYGLSDVMPEHVTISVPPGTANPPDGAPFRVHRAIMSSTDVRPWDGLRVTIPERAIVESAATGTGPEQIELAVYQAIARALVGPEDLRGIANRPGYRHRRTVISLIEGAIADAESRLGRSPRHT